jgi:glyoxalase family protein
MNATPAVLGIHHVTAMAGDAQVNLDFYTRVLGLRLVKRTVNFDDPGTYHLYFGDRIGTPGTILTFFPWGARSLRGRIGTGQVSVTSFSIPTASVSFWMDRLKRLDVAVGEPTPRFDETALRLRDRDGVGLELVAAATADARPGWSNGDVPIEHSIRGFHHAALSLAGYERTAVLLTTTLGFRAAGEAGQRFRFVAGEGTPGAIVDLVCEPGRMRGSMGVGVVHHIAYRAATDEAQRALRQRIVDAGHDATPVLDRQYFHSVYFREPGGVLFEIATDPPGFSIDEPVAEFGRSLKLPSWLESQRDEIEASVTPLTVPASNNP